MRANHRPSRANKIAAVGLLLGLPLAVLNGDHSETSFAPPTRVEHVDTASLARVAMAHRYSGCEITGVTDHHEARKGLTVGLGESLRDSVDIRLHLAKDPAAERSAALYADSNAVTWLPAQLIVRERVLSKHGVEALGRPVPSTEQTYERASEQPLTMDISAYPFSSSKPGRTLDVLILADGESGHMPGEKSITVTASRHCGTLVLEQTASGPEWQQDPAALPSGEFERTRTCDLVGDYSQPGGITVTEENCSVVTR